MAKEESLSDALDALIAAQGQDAVLAAMVARAGGADRANEWIARSKTGPVKDRFAGGLREGQAIVLTVNNWAAIRELADKPITAESSPALVFEELLAEVQAAIVSRDAQALLEGWALIWKAVKRG